MVIGVLWLALSGATAAHAHSCADYFGAIKKQAMYCGFFCDNERILALQQSYEAACMKGAVIAPSPFDIDAASLDTKSVKIRTLGVADSLGP
jgi:hypothetical protein